MSRAVIALLLVLLCGATHAAELPVRDPMRPFSADPAAGGAAAAAAPRFELTAVLLGAERRVAVINGKPYLLGESVGDVRIVAIEAQAVRLDDGGRELVIPLGRGKSPPPIVQGETVP